MKSAPRKFWSRFAFLSLIIGWTFASGVALAASSPSITTQPRSQSVLNNSNATLSVVASGQTPLFYQWYLNNTNRLTNSPLVSGATNSVLKLSIIAQSEPVASSNSTSTLVEGPFKVVVSNSHGTATSSNAFLTVLFPAEITSGPSNNSLILHSNVTISAAVVGSGSTTFTWYFNGAPLQDGGRISGSTTANLNISNAQTTDAGFYQLAVTNAYGSDISTPATLTVLVPPSITAQPTDQVALPGSFVVFSAMAAGDAPLFYQWQKNGTNLVNGALVSGATSSALTLSNIQTSDFGSYRLVLSNAYGVAASAEAGLAIVPIVAWGDPSYGETNAPLTATNVIAIAGGAEHSLALRSDGTVVGWGYNAYGQTTPPAELTNAIGIAGGVYYSLALKSDGTVIGWGYDGNGRATPPPGLSNVVAIASGGLQSLALKSDGTVVGWGDDSYGQATPPAGLSNVVAIAAGSMHSMALRSDGTIVDWGDNTYGEGNPPSGLSDVVAIAAGSSHGFALRSDGTVTNWGYLEGGYLTSPPVGLGNIVAIAAGAAHDLALKSDGTVTGWGCPGSSSPCYGQAFPPPGLSNVAIIAAGQTHSLALLQNPALKIPPTIQWQPPAPAVPTGQTLLFHPYVTGSLPLAFQWYFNGAPITGQTNNWLALTGIQPAQEGNYQFIVTNNFGAATSQVFTVAELPGFVTPPQNGIAFAGSNQTFTANVQGHGPFAYQWYLDGVALLDSTRIAGSTTTNLTILDVQPSDAGTYSLAATNATGPTIAQASLVVASQPASQTVLVGTNALLSITVSAPTQPGFAWLKNGIALTDSSHFSGTTTSSLSISNLQTADSGAYQVIISNNPTVVTSAVATVTVVVPVFITNQPTGRSSPAGLPTVFSVVATGTAPLFYQWLLNGANISDATNFSYTNPSLSIDDFGAYQVVVSNAGGAVTSSVAMLTLGPVAAWGNNSSGQALPPPGLSNVVAVAAGNLFSLALKGDGTVVAWGSSPVTNVPSNVSNIVAIAAGSGFGLGVRNDGTVVGWGSGGATNVPGSVNNVVSVSGASNHALGLRSEGVLTEWGTGNKTPVPAGLTKVVSFADGAGFGLAAKADGTVVDWGTLNFYTVLSPISPLPVTNAVAVACGYSHLLVLKADGSVFAYAQNPGSFGSPSVTNVPASLTNAIAISAEGADSVSDYSLALRSNGLVVGWGANSLGPTNIPPGLSNVVAIAAGANHSLALVSDGSPVIIREPVGGTAFSSNQFTLTTTVAGQGSLIYSWSLNGTNIPNATNASFIISNASPSDAGTYQLTVSNLLGQAASVPVPVTVLDSAPFILTFPAATNRAPIGSPLTLRSVVGGSGPPALQWQLDGQDVPGQTNPDFNFSRIRSTNGGGYTLIASNAFGSITSSIAKVFPVSLIGWGASVYGTINVPLTLTNAIAVAISFESAEALRTDGTVTNWGMFSSTPADVTNIVEVAPGSSFGMGLRANGTVKTWSAFGAFSNSMASLSNIISLVSDGTTAAFLRSDGTVVRILTTGATNLFPQLSNAVALARFTDGFAALRADGTIFASGTGALPPASANSNVVDFALERGYGAVLKRDKSLQTWGVFGGPTNLQNIITICANAAVRSNGTVAAWTWTPNNPQLTNVPPGLANVGALEGTGSATMALLLPRDPAQALLPTALDTTALVVSSHGSPQWFGQTNVTHDGVNAAQSAEIGNNTASSMRMWIAGPVTVSFWWKVSSETNRDFLSFSAGGVLLTNISGETGWQQCTVATPPGNQILKWTYSKDAAGSAGQDAAWVDQLVITPVAPSILTQPASSNVIGGNNATFTVLATGTPPLNYQWLKGSNTLPGATGSSLTLFTVTRTNSGTYSVIVTNLAGSTNSSDAILKVHVPQLLSVPVSQPDQTIVFNSSDVDGGALSASDLANFQVQASSNLVDWVSLPGTLTLTNGQLQLRDTDATNASTRFYRIVETWTP
jgi:alpha-tubulin suppressor-like RCC1 family protein